MLHALRARLRQGHQTIAFPRGSPVLPDRFRGLLALNRAACEPQCTLCADACPTAAIDQPAPDLAIDLGKCLFCGVCTAACPTGALQHTPEFRLATSRRADLRYAGDGLALAGRLDAKLRALLGRSLKLRQVSAGGCNGCEVEVNALSNVVFDIGRFGIDFVASPRHADGLLVTGPVTRNMREALLRTYAAMPAPKIVIATGACAISGGPFAGLAEQNDGLGELLPVDLFIPGCPPHPLTLLDGILRVLDRLDDPRQNPPPDSAADTDLGCNPRS